MIRNEGTTYNYGDYFNGGLLFVPEDPTGCGLSGFSGISDLQMKEIHNCTESNLTDVSNHVTPLKTESLIDHFEVKSYGQLFETAGPMCSSQYCGLTNEKLDTMELNHWMPLPNEEAFSTETCMDMEYQQSKNQAFQLQPVNMSCALELQSTLKGKTAESGLSAISILQQNQAFQLQPVNMSSALELQSTLKGKTAESGLSATPLKSMLKRSREEKAKGEYNRRYAVNEKLQALHEVLPSSLKGCNRESVVENAMDYIKQLQVQLKVLSASRLGGQSTSVPLVFVEGHGHYYQHDKMFEKSLEEFVGRLIEENPAAAQKFLERKGFYMMPFASVDALSRAE